MTAVQDRAEDSRTEPERGEGVGTPVTHDVLRAFTPGPWHWLIHDHSCASLGVGDDPGMGTPLVMSVSPCRSCADRVKDGEWKWGRCTTPSEADARLIAAAPDLLQALQTFLDEYMELVDSGDAGNWDGEKEPKVIAARAAIAKARGAL